MNFGQTRQNNTGVNWSTLTNITPVCWAIRPIGCKDTIRTYNCLDHLRRSEGQGVRFGRISSLILFRL